MNYFVCIASLVLFICCLVGIGPSRDRYRVQKEGRIVEMEIVRLPPSCGGRKLTYFVDFRFEENIFSRSFKGGFCQRHRVGEKMQMKLFDGIEYILFPDESVTIEFFALFGLAIVSIYCFVVHAKKIKSGN